MAMTIFDGNHSCHTEEYNLYSLVSRVNFDIGSGDARSTQVATKRSPKRCFSFEHPKYLHVLSENELSASFALVCLFMDGLTLKAEWSTLTHDLLVAYIHEACVYLS